MSRSQLGCAVPLMLVVAAACSATPPETFEPPVDYSGSYDVRMHQTVPHTQDVFNCFRYAPDQGCAFDTVSVRIVTGQVDIEPGYLDLIYRSTAVVTVSLKATFRVNAVEYHAPSLPSPCSGAPISCFLAFTPDTQSVTGGSIIVHQHADGSSRMQFYVDLSTPVRRNWSVPVFHNGIAGYDSTSIGVLEITRR